MEFPLAGTVLEWQVLAGVMDDAGALTGRDTAGFTDDCKSRIIRYS